MGRRKLGKPVQYTKEYCKWRKGNERDRVRNYLMSLYGDGEKFRCQICGFEHTECGVFDKHHLDPTTKSFKGGQGLTGRGFENFKEELKKCIFICANCHRIIHATMIVPQGIRPAMEDPQLNLF